MFGLAGPWTRLLFESDGYLGTEVRCEIPETRQYRVRDFWAWHRSFEKFRSQRQADFERFEGWVASEGLIEKEQFLGAYYEKFGEGSEEDLVLS